MPFKDVESAAANEGSNSPKYILDGYSESKVIGCKINGVFDGFAAVLFSGQFSDHAMLTRYRYGVRSGKFMIVDGSGNAVIEGTCMNGDVDGLTTVLYTSTGRVRMRGMARRGMWHGEVEEFGECGEIVFRGEYECGHRVLYGMLPIGGVRRTLADADADGDGDAAPDGLDESSAALVNGECAQSKRRRWIPIYADPDLVASGHYTNDRIEDDSEANSPTRFELSDRMCVRSLVVGNNSFRNVRLLLLVSLPELAEVEIGSCCFTRATFDQETGKFCEDDEPFEEWYSLLLKENRSAMFVGCAKLRSVKIDWGSFADFISLAIARCDSLTDLAIGGTRYASGTNCCGSNFHWAKEFLLRGVTAGVVLSDALMRLVLFAPHSVACDSPSPDLPSLTSITISGRCAFFDTTGFRLESE